MVIDMNDVLALEKAVTRQPECVTTQLVLADALTENGADYDKAVSAAQEIAKKAASRREKARLRYLLRGTSVQEIERQLAIANRGRKVRMLSLDDIIWCVKSARKHGIWSKIGGGTVANAYKYRSYQTACVAAIRSNGTVVVVIREIDARKHTSITNQLVGLTRISADSAYREWADSVSTEEEEDRYIENVINNYPGY